MSKIKFSVIFIYVIIIFSSCSISKSPLNKVDIEDDKLTDEQKFEFRSFFFEANRLFIKGDTELALDLYNKCLTIDSKSAIIYYKIASIYLSKNDFLTAENYALKSLEFEGNNEWYMYLAGSLLAQNKKYSEAIKIFENLINIKNTEIDLYIKLSDIYLLDNKVSDAIRIYNKAENKFGINEAISMQKYKLFIAQKKNEEALKEIIKLSDSFDNLPIYERLIAEFYIYKNDINAAINKYQEIISTNESDGYSNIGLAECYQIKGNFKESIEQIKIAFNSDDVTSDDKINLLLSFIQNQNANKEVQVAAYELTEILVRKYPENPDLNIIYANFLIQNNLLIDARVFLRKVVEVRKDKYEVWEQLLLINNQLADWKSLYEESSIALEYFPNQSFIYFFNGFSAFQLNKIDEAQTSFEFGFKLITKEDPLRKDYLTFLGEVYYKNNEKEKAFKLFDELLTIDSDNLMVLNNYAYYLSLDKNQLNKAKEMSLKTIQNEPKNSTYLDTYAWVLFTMKNYNEALIYMLKAVEFDNYNSNVLVEHLGDIYFHIGDIEKALINWNKAMESDKNNKKLYEKINKKTYIE